MDTLYISTSTKLSFDCYDDVDEVNSIYCDHCFTAWYWSLRETLWLKQPVHLSAHRGLRFLTGEVATTILRQG